MAKNPIKQIQVPGTTPTTYDIQDNTLVAGDGITITESTETGHEGERIISASGGEGITEISTQEVRIWSLDPGIYKLTYNGQKLILYKGSTSSEGVYLGESGVTGGEVFITITSYIESSAHYKYWYICYRNAITTLNDVPGFYLGYTTSTDGFMRYIASESILTSHQSIKSLNTNNSTAQTVNSSEAITGTGSIKLHKVSKTGSYNDLLNTPTIPSISANPSTTTDTLTGLTIDGTSYAIGGGIPEISSQNIKIWSEVDPGIYKLTYNGTKYIYYKGNAETSTSYRHTVTGGSYPVILYVSRNGNSKYWWYSNDAKIYSGFTSSVDGVYYGAQGLRVYYLHVLTFTDYNNNYGNFQVIIRNTVSTSYTSTTSVTSAWSAVYSATSAQTISATGLYTDPIFDDGGNIHSARFYWGGVDEEDMYVELGYTEVDGGDYSTKDLLFNDYFSRVIDNVIPL